MKVFRVVGWVKGKIPWVSTRVVFVCRLALPLLVKVSFFETFQVRAGFLLSNGYGYSGLSIASATTNCLVSCSVCVLQFAERHPLDFLARF